MRPPRFRHPLAWLITLAVLSASMASPFLVLASDSDPFIRSIKLREGNGSVLLSADLEARLGDQIKEAVRGGVPLTIRYGIRLTRKGSILGEKMVRSEELIHTLQYNPVKKVYLFEGIGYGEVLERRSRDEKEALLWMTRITDWPLYALDDLKRETRYKVRVMATLRSVELPSVLGYLFFFTTIFNKETGWKEVDFSY